MHSHPDDDRPGPSDFREEMQEQAYLAWCGREGLDPDDQDTARAYEGWFEEQSEI